MKDDTTTQHVAAAVVDLLQRAHHWTTVGKRRAERGDVEGAVNALLMATDYFAIAMGERGAVDSSHDLG